MGRRSVHSPDELRQLILTSARTIIEKNGLPGLSAREIAKLIGYSPGTLYNIFENLDDVLLNLQITTFSEMHHVLASTPAGATPELSIDALTDAYVEYALDNRQMWNLLFAHQLQEGSTVPPALHTQFSNCMDVIQNAIKPLMSSYSTQQDLISTAYSLWAGVHGITAVAVTQKGQKITALTVRDHVRRLTSMYLAGLRVHTARQCAMGAAAVGKPTFSSPPSPVDD